LNKIKDVDILIRICLSYEFRKKTDAPAGKKGGVKPAGASG
jgi:hypothetical protein